MTVPEEGGSMEREDGARARDRFPVGMRVLAVDDDETCLNILEKLLLHCRYHVTTTTQAIMALKMLRENRDQFDLIISDVQMPDMDGFKLLELVGLEMDLPVIMVSANDETETVMKGITHGACDYLIKPITIQAIKNIWQHVIRKRKCDARDVNNFVHEEGCDKSQIGNSEGDQDRNEASDRDGKHNRKRKDQNDEDEDDCEEDENENESEDPSAPKKPRVVWSVDLHHKFVAAVNHLGIDKAVPKKILDLMNVERLTRENVASHLQKYRLYLKRLSTVASQQANMDATFRGRNPSYLPMGSLEGIRNFHSLMRSGQPPAVTPFQPNGVLGRMNSPTGFGQQRFVPSGSVQHGRIHNNTSDHINDLRALQGIGLLGNPHGSLLQGMPMSMELARMQQQKTLMETNNRFAGGVSGTGLSIGSSSNSFANMTSKPLLLHATQQHTVSGVLGSHSDSRPSLSSDHFKNGLRDSSQLPDISRYNDPWQSAVRPTQYVANNSSMVAGSFHDPSNIQSNICPIISQMDNNLHEVSSSSSAVLPLCDAMIGKDVQRSGSSLGGSTIPTMNYSLSNIHMVEPIADNQTMNNGFPNEMMDMPLVGQNSGASYLAQKTDYLVNYKEEFIVETRKIHSGFTSNNGYTFDDLVNSITKPDHREDANFFDGDIVGDLYSLSTCM